MRFQLAKLATVAAVIVGLAACSRSAMNAQDNGDVRALTRVRVENQAFLDMNVYVLSDAGSRTRLGTVTGNTSSTFVIPDYVIGPASSVRFLVEPIGSNRAPISNALSVQPGQTITLTIPPTG